jgi:hypothetical protein
MSKDEVDRLMRLRQQQLKARDPHAKQRAIERKVARRRARTRKQPGSYLEVFTDVPRKWQGVVIGILLGMFVWVGLNLWVSASWVDSIGLAAIVGLAIIGFYFGQAVDTRDELRELMRD